MYHCIQESSSSFGFIFASKIWIIRLFVKTIGKHAKTSKINIQYIIAQRLIVTLEQELFV